MTYKLSKKVKYTISNKVCQNRNQQRTACRGARESKSTISGQNVLEQEPTTYNLWRWQRKQTHHQWPECSRTGTNNLHAVEVAEKANPLSMARMSQNRNQQLTYCGGGRESKSTISGQNVLGQKPTTYTLWRCQRTQIHHQWPECPRTGTNNLQSIEVPEKANPLSVD